MKKLLLIALGMLLLSGCTVQSNEKSSRSQVTSRFTVGSSGEHLSDDETSLNAHYVLTDKESTVEYLVVTTSRNSETAGIATTPILSSDGNLYTDKVDHANDPSRFITNDYAKDYTSDKSYSQHYVLEDRFTGVQYLVVTSATDSANAGIAITPILNKNGKPQPKNTCACTTSKEE